MCILNSLMCWARFNMAWFSLQLVYCSVFPDTRKSQQILFFSTAMPLLQVLSYPEIIWEIWIQRNTVRDLCARSPVASVETLRIYGKSLMVNTYSSNYMIRSLCYVEVPCLVQSEMLFLFLIFYFFTLLLLNFLFIFSQLDSCFPSSVPFHVSLLPGMPIFYSFPSYKRLCPASLTLRLCFDSAMCSAAALA